MITLATVWRTNGMDDGGEERKQWEKLGKCDNQTGRRRWLLRCSEWWRMERGWWNYWWTIDTWDLQEHWPRDHESIIPMQETRRGMPSTTFHRINVHKAGAHWLLAASPCGWLPAAATDSWPRRKEILCLLPEPLSPSSCYSRILLELGAQIPEAVRSESTPSHVPVSLVTTAQRAHHSVSSPALVPPFPRPLASWGSVLSCLFWCFYLFLPFQGHWF